MATPKNYVIGPDDEIAIDVFGYQEANFKLIVSPEGNINLPAVGYIAVNGLTVEQATKRIKDRMIKNGRLSICNLLCICAFDGNGVRFSQIDVDLLTLSIRS